jgi:hypothetical protein
MSEVAHYFWSIGLGFGDIREDEQLGASLQGHPWHKEGDSWTVSWGLEVAQLHFTHIKASEQLSIAQYVPRFEVAPVLSSQDV